ncbi:MAG: DUF2871 domain-containing protein [Erysipelotrichaceae bacterium]
MKKLFNYASMYAVLGLGLGVFYREFTKMNGFTSTTTLGFLHVHTLVLGMLIFLLLIIFEKEFHVMDSKHYKKFMIFYNIGLLSTLTMLLVRGVTQVLNIKMSTGMNYGISGMSGVSHIILAIGFVFMFLMIKEKIQSEK